METVLVTGGTGFVGKWIYQTAPINTQVFAFNRQGYEDNILDHVFGVNYIIHLANVEPSRVIEAAKRNHARLLYCSSGAAYNQKTEYANNKRKWERQCLDSGVDVVITRLFTFYESARSHLAFREAAKMNRPIVITGDGNTVRSYMYGDELGRWMWRILKRGRSGEIYDVGSHIPVKMIDFAKQIKAEYESMSDIIVQNGVDDVPYYMPYNLQKTWELW